MTPKPPITNPTRKERKEECKHAWQVISPSETPYIEAICIRCHEIKKQSLAKPAQPVDEKVFKHNPNELWVCPDCLGINGCMCALAPTNKPEWEDVGHVVTFIGTLATQNTSDPRIWFTKKDYKRACEGLTDFISDLLKRQKQSECKCIYGTDGKLVGLCLRCMKLQLEAVNKDRKQQKKKLLKKIDNLPPRLLKNRFDSTDTDNFSETYTKDQVISLIQEEE